MRLAVRLTAIGNVWGMFGVVGPDDDDDYEQGLTMGSLGIFILEDVEELKGDSDRVRFAIPV